jgi:serine/threonine protein kinase/lipopolysaccharide biosynthesis regulator YciM
MKDKADNQNTEPDDRWELLWALFDQAVSGDSQHQQEITQRAQREHPDCYQELVEMLEAHHTAHPLLDQPAHLQELEHAFTVPEQIGGYQIIEPLGTGGSGDVFKARQAREGFEHVVAIKMAPFGRYAKWVLDAFNNELKMLLSLNHPNIERLYEGGVSSANIPYLVVEYIDGAHLDVHCDQQRLNLKQRIRLFIQVCDAVATLHQSLIIHRDIKVSNIMVDQQGTAKLLDFGLAKISDIKPQDEPGEMTLSGWMMTLAYASPEQVKGEPITTASDVYALGVVLYALLCGQLPHQINAHDLADAARQITEVEPPPASEHINRQAVINAIEGNLKGSLKGELDAILSKALQKDPARRYASAQQLADDLLRYLHQQPVLARPDSVWYRMKKFTQRHFIGVVSTSLFVFALVLLSVLLFNRSVELEQSLAATQEEKQRVRQVTDFLIDVFKTSDPLLSQTDVVDVKSLLDHASEELSRQFDDQPATKAKLYETLGSVYLNMSDVQQAEVLLAEAKKTGASRSPLDRLEALLIEARLLQNKGELQDALTLLQGFRSRHQELSLPPVLDMQLGLMLGQLLSQSGDAQGAIREISQAKTRLQQANPSSAEYKISQIEADMNHLLGSVYWKLGDWPQVKSHYQASYQSNLRRLGEAHHLTLKSLSALGVLDYARGRYAEALEQLNEVLIQRQTHLGDQHYLTAEAHNRVGAAHYELGHLEAAETHYQAAIDGLQLSGLDQSIKFTRVLNNLGLIKRQQKHYRQATRLFSQALSIQTDLLGESHPDLAAMLNNLGLSAYDQNHLAEALSWFQKSYDLQYQANGREHVNIAFPMTNIGRMYVLSGQPEQVGRWLDDALQLRADKLGTNNLLYAASLMAKAEWAWAVEDWVLSRELANQALSIRADQLAGDDWRVAVSRHLLNSLAHRQGDESVNGQLACDLAVIEAQFGEAHPMAMLARQRIPAVTAAHCE